MNKTKLKFDNYEDFIEARKLYEDNSFKVTSHFGGRGKAMHWLEVEPTTLTPKEILVSHRQEVGG